MPELILNQKVEIEKTTDNHPEYYPSYIVALEAETISLAAPLARGRFVFFFIGEPIRVYAGTVSFASQVVGRRAGEHPLLIVSRPAVLEKRQRRNFVRLEVSLPVTVRLQEEGGADTAGVQEEIRTQTVNISGGGALLNFPRELPLGTDLELALQLPAEEIACRAKVKRVIPGNRGEHFFRVGVEFVDLDPRQQDTIVGFVFQRQLELRRKGLL